MGWNLKPGGRSDPLVDPASIETWNSVLFYLFERQNINQTEEGIICWRRVERNEGCLKCWHGDGSCFYRWDILSFCDAALVWLVYGTTLAIPSK